MSKLLPVVSLALVFFIVAIMCILFPYRIQSFVIDLYSKHPTLAKLNPFIDWMKSDGYIWSLRVVGVIAFLGFVALVYVSATLFRG